MHYLSSNNEVLLRFCILGGATISKLNKVFSSFHGLGFGIAPDSCPLFLLKNCYITTNFTLFFINNALVSS